jgi:hypothetical protein
MMPFTPSKPCPRRLGAASASQEHLLSLLVEALSCPERYRLTERQGELFIEPVR